MKPTQTQIAKQLGISDSQFSRILSGDQHLKLIPARKLCEIIPSSPDIWQEGGGTSEMRRTAYWDYLLITDRERKGE